MILDTYYKVLSAQIGSNSGGITIKNWAGVELALKKATSADNYAGAMIFANISNVNTAVDGSSGVVFGTGSSVAPDDYTISGDVISGISYNTAISYFNDGAKAEKTVVYTITNNNETDITISEIGYFEKVPAGKNSSATTYSLIEHTVLDSPVTIPAGGVGQITYTIRMNFPTV